MLRTSFFVLCVITILSCLSACVDDPNTLRVGTMVGPESDLVDTAKHIAKERYGLKIQVVRFTDYSLPNTALADGSIDVNVFQHTPYLNQANKARHYNLVPVANMFIYPMGLYSKRLQQLSDIPQHGTIAIPSDPANQTRALALLSKAGLISLSPNKRQGELMDLRDMIGNPKQLTIKALNAAQLPRVLDDVDIAAINTNYALEAGLSLRKDALYQEGSDSDYANIIVVRAADRDSPSIKAFVQSMHAPAVIEKARALFGDQAIIGWE